MARSMRVTTVVAVLILLSSRQQGFCEESLSKGATKKRCAELISQLVSPNKEPTTRNGADSSVTFPPGYDVKAQQRIQAARQVLYDNIEEALPYLVQALDDKHYCMTINWADGDAYYNKSVGDICRNIIASQLEVYRDAIRFSDAGHWNYYDYPITKKWYEKRKGRSFAKLQIEAIEWAIDRRKGEPEEQLSDEEISDLQKLRNSIAKSGRPAIPKRRKMLRMVTHNQ